MVIVHVYIHVKAEDVQPFRDATEVNAGKSVQEPGIARFDVIQQQGDPERFILVEVYRSEADIAKHKETQHYEVWRETVAEMMAEPRQGVKFTNVFPADEGWD
jgi:quinol monooxygenase YgiN